METVVSELLANIELSCNVLDMSSCVFIMILMIVSSVQRWNRNIHHFLSGLILLLNGISCHVLVRALEFAHRTDGGPAMIRDGTSMMDQGKVPRDVPGGNIQHFISMITAPGNADTLIRVICFTFIVFSIDQFFVQAVSVREPFERKNAGKHRIIIEKIAIIIAGIVIYLLTDREEVLTAIIMAYLLAGLYSILKNEAFVFRRTPVIMSVLLTVLSCAVSLAVPPMRFTGIALTIMYVILYIEFHTYVETELSIREAELAESRIRLMNEQITSHFAFNSLKVIENMCRTDPVKAGQTINAFSKYLRSNIESITAPGMIPFEEELEHTKQYIELEQLEGSASFIVQYDIETSDFKVPPLILEPLAENAIKHGVKVCGADTITLSTCVKDGRVMITVRDNGSANMRKDPGIMNHRRSIALDNIRSRLRLQCEGTLDIVYTEQGTVATISIPRTAT